MSEDFIPLDADIDAVINPDGFVLFAGTTNETVEWVGERIDMMAGNVVCLGVDMRIIPAVEYFGEFEASVKEGGERK